MPDSKNNLATFLAKSERIDLSDDRLLVYAKDDILCGMPPEFSDDYIVESFSGSCQSHSYSHSYELIKPNIVCRTLDELIGLDDKRFNLPRFFYIKEHNYLYTSSDSGAVPDQIQGYINACYIYSLLKEFADHINPDSNDGTLVFLSPKGKMSLEIKYVLDDISLLHEYSTQIQRLSVLLRDPKHDLQKKTIAKSCLFTLLGNVGNDLRYSELLRHFDNLYSMILGSYELYINEDFDFHEIKQTYEKIILEYITKVADVFSSIQAKLLAIPLAIVLALYKLKPDGVSLLEKSMIVIGALTLSQLVTMLLDSQSDALKTTEKEIKFQENKLKTEYKILFDELSERFACITNKVSEQNNRLCCVRWMNNIFACMSLSVFLYSISMIKLFREITVSLSIATVSSILHTLKELIY